MSQSDNIERLLEELIEKIDILTKVVGINVVADKSTTERARILKLAGMDNQSIAKILNTSQGTIRTLTSNLLKRRM